MKTHCIKCHARLILTENYTVAKLQRSDYRCNTCYNLQSNLTKYRRQYRAAWMKLETLLEQREREIAAANAVRWPVNDEEPPPDRTELIAWLLILTFSVALTLLFWK